MAVNGMDIILIDDSSEEEESVTLLDFKKEPRIQLKKDPMDYEDKTPEPLHTVDKKGGDETEEANEQQPPEYASMQLESTGENKEGSHGEAENANGEEKGTSEESTKNREQTKKDLPNESLPDKDNRMEIVEEDKSNEKEGKASVKINSELQNKGTASEEADKCDKGSEPTNEDMHDEKVIGSGDGQPNEGKETEDNNKEKNGSKESTIREQVMAHTGSQQENSVEAVTNDEKMLDDTPIVKIIESDTVSTDNLNEDNKESLLPKKEVVVVDLIDSEPEEEGAEEIKDVTPTTNVALASSRPNGDDNKELEEEGKEEKVEAEGREKELEEEGREVEVKEDGRGEEVEEDNDESEPVQVVILKEATEEDASDNGSQVKVEISGEEAGDGQFSLEELLPAVVMCTACGKKVNPLKKGVCQHPTLGVLVCKSCNKFYNSSPFYRDSNGMEEHCKWCAEGGTLVMCDFCEKVYCEQCIKRNLGKDFYNMLLNADESLKWQCFSCDKSQLEQLQMQSNLIMKTVDQLKIKGVLASKQTGNDHGGPGAVERRERLTSLSESLGSPLPKNKHFGLDTLDGNDASSGPKNVVEKVRKRKNRIEDSNEETSESSSAPSDDDSGDEQYTFGAEAKVKGKKKKQKKTKTVKQKDIVKGKSGSGKRKSRTTKQNEPVVNEGSSDEDDNRHVLKVKLKTQKSRMKTRKKGKLLIDISDPGLGTSKSYVNEECFSSDASVDETTQQEIKSMSLRDVGDVELNECFVKMEEIDPDKLQLARKIQNHDSVTCDLPSSDTDEGDSHNKSREDHAQAKDASTTSRASGSLGKHGEDSSLTSTVGVSKTMKKNTGRRKKIRPERWDASKRATEHAGSEKETTQPGEDDVEKGGDAEEERKGRTEESVGKAKKQKRRKAEKTHRIIPSSEEAEKEEEDKEDITNDAQLEEVEDDDDKQLKKDSSEEDSGSGESSEPQKKVKGKSRKKSRVRKISSSSNSQSSESDSVEEENLRRSTRSRKRLASTESSSSSSDVGPAKSGSRKARTTNTRKRRRLRRDTSDEESQEESENATSNKKKRKAKKGQKGKKRKRTRRNSDDSDEDSNSDKESPSKKGRKNIRRILRDEELTEETRHARLLEEERRKRLLARTETKETEKEKEGREDIDGELVLERDGNGKVLVSVAPQICSYLKPHQRDGLKFMYDCVVESVNKWKSQEYEGGCLLAHCMGLGKTLQVVSFVHTLINSEHIGLSRVLVVAPLNTVLNWQVEFEKWLGVDDRLDVYVLQDAGPNRWKRVDMISDWYTYGGVLVMGYDMYRNLSQLLRIRSKKQKELITKALVDPGPELVVCDEGHILRNDQSAISKALNKIKTKRRVVLTGTPLQNNLIEYHCMVNFVKPSLLGTRKEFTNRFVNPILNGQCSNSTASDVRVMKHRCHILHELLSGCVMRRDYSVLTPFLSPKREYTIFVRLSEKQRKMYQYYLDTFVCKDLEEVKARGVSLFSDYQCLMRIWTHPWAVKLEALRRIEREKYQDDMEDFLDDDTEESAAESEDKKYKKGSDSSDFESASNNRKQRKGKMVESGVSEVSEEEVEDHVGEEVIPTRRRTRASAAASRGKSLQANNRIRPSFVLPNKRSPGKISDDDGDAEKDKGADVDKDEEGASEEDDIVVVQPSREPSHKTTRSGSCFNVLNEKSNDVEDEEDQEWYDQFLTQEDEHEIQISGKLVILMELLTDAELVGDKVLVFSQSLVSLDLIEKCLGNGKIGGDRLNWCRGVDYFRMDGSTNAQTRQRYAEIFNDSESSCRLFLISTKAGSLGINLIAANRVVIFDCSWNPSHDVQSIFRVYRFGQSKPVFVYRLVSQGSMEEKIYNRQITKMAIAGRVVDEQQIERHFTDEEIRELYIFQPDVYNEGDNVEIPVLPKDPLLAEVVQRQHPKWIVRYHEHDLLLEHIEDEKLSEEERKQAWAQYEEEKSMNANYLARMQLEQERMKELAKAQEQGLTQPPHIRQTIPPPLASAMPEGSRISAAQAEAIFQHIQASCLPGQVMPRSQIFRQYTDTNGRTITKMQIPFDTAVRMVQAPQDHNRYPPNRHQYMIDGLTTSQRPSYRLPSYGGRALFVPRTTAAGANVIYRPNAAAGQVRQMLGYDPYQPRPFGYRPGGQIFRLPGDLGR